MSTVVVLLIGFLLGVIFGPDISNFIYNKVAEIKASVTGTNAIIEKTGSISIRNYNDSMYIYIDIPKPAKTVLYIPLNESNGTCDYYYNISDNLDASTRCYDNNIDIFFRWKLPVVP